MSARVVRRRLPTVLAFAVLTLVLPALGACGKKPSHVDPPEGAELQVYPRTYPNERFDPVPVGGKPPGAAGASPAGTAPAVLPPLTPTQAYPSVIRIDAISPNSTLNSPVPAPNQGSGTPSWGGSTTRGQ